MLKFCRSTSQRWSLLETTVSVGYRGECSYESGSDRCWVSLVLGNLMVSVADCWICWYRVVVVEGMRRFRLRRDALGSPIKALAIAIGPTGMTAIGRSFHVGVASSELEVPDDCRRR